MLKQFALPSVWSQIFFVVGCEVLFFLWLARPGPSPLLAPMVGLSLYPPLICMRHLPKKPYVKSSLRERQKKAVAREKTCRSKEAYSPRRAIGRNHTGSLQLPDHHVVGHVTPGGSVGFLDYSHKSTLVFRAYIHFILTSMYLGRTSQSVTYLLIAPGQTH
jgi:hypothetical protein